jgi:pimeloyl-ACP methyl ester carboxylesterase
MPKTRVGDLELAYETHGDPSGGPILLIMGLGVQLVGWEQEFIDLLVARGHHVIRFDNRDVGQSTHLRHLSSSTVMEAVMRAMTGQPVEAPYALSDMADDAFGLLNALGIESAHLVGVSMGGMIAQMMALRTPGRVRSLTSIMSTTGERSLPPPKTEAMQSLVMLLSSDRDAANIDEAVEAFRALSSPGFPYDVERMRRRLRAQVERGFSAAGVARQFLAILTAPSRAEALRSLAVPTLVIHGEGDPLIPLAAGQATAAAIQGARLWTVPGMGHDMPAALFDPLATAIADHAASAEARAAAAR